MAEQENEEISYDDEEGAQAFEGAPLDKELVTHAYEPPAKSIVEDIQKRELIVNPPFQRRKVWNRTKQSRLIESLLLNIPIPVCFFAEDSDGKRVVVDGQQRLRSIEEFTSGAFPLEGLQVLSELNGKRWVDLNDKQTRTIRNRTIRCIVISEKSNPDIRFEVFQRLNTGVVPLTEQELRNCTYRGPLNELLHNLAEYPEWLALLRKSQPDARMAHEELILRYFAVNDSLSTYKPPLKKLLNDFMGKNRNASPETLATLTKQFKSAVERVLFTFGEKAFRRVKVDKAGNEHWDSAINRAVFEIQLIGLMDLDLQKLKSASDQILERFAAACREPEFSEAITKSTADKAKLTARMKRFATILKEVGVPSQRLNSLPG